VSWEARATTDPARIRRGWAEVPYNVGVAPGPSGLVVIDLDQPKPGEQAPARWAAPNIIDGTDVLATLCEEHDEPLPFETLMVTTPSGGMHLYFTAPDSLALRNTQGQDGKLGWLVDVRAHGGYVLAPGSIVGRPDGTEGRYELLYDRPPAPLPEWLATLLSAPGTSSPLLECVPGLGDQVSNLDAYVRAALQGEGGRVRTAAEGGRTWALNKAGYCLGRLVAAGVLPEDLAEAVLMEAAAVHFDAARPVTPAEARASVRGGIAAGKRHPRVLGGAA
jgi:hypothetical protein